ncbi:helix-turn-helix transcriptional regulator [Dactylosporangium sp. NPDC048998]|uniref:helix-turn-helix transcriptional regulator n=1 Tax=Dactylosporangium sp. NPDC048998 TaxID=3363976 RepID=UPI0037219ACB
MSLRHTRHVGILLQLRSRPWVSAAALSCRFGVDVRTIYLDIDLLTAAGLPIEAVPGRAGAYRLAAHTELPPIEEALGDSGEPLDHYLRGARSRDQLRHLGQRAYACQQRLRLHRLRPHVGRTADPVRVTPRATA